MPHRAALRRPTLKDVSAVAGVSIKTAARAVNGEPGVAPDKVDAVLRAVAQLSYRRDPLASGLRRNDRRTAALAALLEDLANPFSAGVHRALEDVAREHDSLILAGSLDEDPQRERGLVQAMVDRRVDALVVAPASADQGYLDEELPPECPVVFVDRTPRGFAADAVVTDNEAASAAAVAHLVAAGHRRIGYVGDLDTIPTAAERRAGYRAGLAAAQVPLDPRLEHPDVRDDAERRVAAVLDVADPPTALFTARNEITVAAVRVLQQRGLGDRVALVGFDDFPLADLVRPGISVIAQSPYDIGRKAGEIVFARLAGDDSPPTTHVVPSRLVRRGSGEIPAPVR